MESKHWCMTLFCGTILLYASRVAMPMSVNAIATEYDWSKTDSGIVLSCFFWGYVCVQAVGGHLADTYGGENILASTVLVWSLVTLFTPTIVQLAYHTSSPIFFIVLSRVLLGLTQGFHFPTIASIISKNLPPAERAPLFGLVMAGSHAGTVICGSVGSLILETFGWEPMFFIIGFTGVLWWMHFSYVFKPAVFEHQMEKLRHKDDDKVQLLKNGDIESMAGEKSPSVAMNQVPPLKWGVLLRKTPFWAAFCAHFCGANAYFTLFSWMPSYFKETFPDSKGWVFNFVPNLAIMVTSMSAPIVASKLIEKGFSTTFVRKLMEGTSQVGIAICLALASGVSDYHSALLFLSAAMALRGLHHGGVAVNPQDFAPNHTGAVFGLMNTASALPGFIGVYAAGYILEAYNSWSYVFSWTAMVCLLGVAAYSAFGTAKQIV